MAVQKVLVILKPDCLSRGLMEEVESLLIAEDFVVVQREIRPLLTREVLFLYEEYSRTETFPILCSYMQSGPSLILVLSAEAAVAKMMGLKGRTGSGRGIRGKYAENFIRNIIHSAETPLKTSREIALFFPNENLQMNKKKTIIGLSGLSESGKSSAGEYFDSRGVRRIKIVHLMELLRLRNQPAMTIGEFVESSVKFNSEWLRMAFVDILLEEMARLDIHACSIESLGDPLTVRYLQERLPEEFISVYIEAGSEKRLQHQMIRENLTDPKKAEAIMLPKDQFKEDFWHMSAIKEIADVVIVNEGTFEEFKAQLEQLLVRYSLT
jgi:nucleoside-diphosphate kinase